jgi:hypothetical protein
MLSTDIEPIAIIFIRISYYPKSKLLATFDTSSSAAHSCIPTTLPPEIDTRNMVAGRDAPDNRLAFR